MAALSALLLSDCRQNPWSLSLSPKKEKRKEKPLFLYLYIYICMYVYDDAEMIFWGCKSQALCGEREEDPVAGGSTRMNCWKLTVLSFSMRRLVVGDSHGSKGVVSLPLSLFLALSEQWRIWVFDSPSPELFCLQQITVWSVFGILRVRFYSQKDPAN